jgi:hypothetical protein
MDPYGPGAHADETRQAQHDRANDSPTDVNNNAGSARSQLLTVDLAGKGFVAMQERRQIIADLKLQEHKSA